MPVAPSVTVACTVPASALDDPDADPFEQIEEEPIDTGGPATQEVPVTEPPSSPPPCAAPIISIAAALDEVSVAPPPGDAEQPPDGSERLAMLSELADMAKATSKMADRRKNRKPRGATFETCNGTGWSAVLERAKCTNADILLIQEHRTTASLIDERSDILAKLGWKSAWSAAVATDGGCGDALHSSGGTAIFARKHIGLGPAFEDEPDVYEVAPSRLVAAALHIPGQGGSFATRRTSPAAPVGQRPTATSPTRSSSTRTAMAGHG